MAPLSVQQERSVPPDSARSADPMAVRACWPPSIRRSKRGIWAGQGRANASGSALCSGDHSEVADAHRRSMSQHIRDQGFDLTECAALEPWRARIRVAGDLDDQNLSPAAVLERI